LATQLRANGIDAILDQWDLTPGKDLVQFMEDGISSSDRVLVVCTEAYAAKADRGHGGVGYEKLILTAELIRDLQSAKFIPLLRSPAQPPPIPRFLGTKLYIDFTEDARFGEQFDLLLRELHKEPMLRKPRIGTNPFLNFRGNENPKASNAVGSHADALRRHSTEPSAIFVLKAWLDSGGEKERLTPYVVDWLQFHGRKQEASFLIVAWLNAGGDKQLVAPYMHEWLQFHGATQQANFVIVAWLNSGGEKELIAPYMHEWLERFTG